MPSILQKKQAKAFSAFACFVLSSYSHYPSTVTFRCVLNKSNVYHNNHESTAQLRHTRIIAMTRGKGTHRMCILCPLGTAVSIRRLTKCRKQVPTKRKQAAHRVGQSKIIGSSPHPKEKATVFQRRKKRYNKK